MFKRMECKECSGKNKKLLMNNKWLCSHCDELLIDLEIECEEEEKVVPVTTSSNVKEHTESRMKLLGNC